MEWSTGATLDCQGMKKGGTMMRLFYVRARTSSSNYMITSMWLMHTGVTAKVLQIVTIYRLQPPSNDYERKKVCQDKCAKHTCQSTSNLTVSAQFLTRLLPTQALTRVLPHTLKKTTKYKKKDSLDKW